MKEFRNVVEAEKHLEIEKVRLDARYMCTVVTFLPEEMAKQFPDGKWESSVADW